MKFDKVVVICFSPTHTSETVAKAIAAGCGIDIVESVDLTYREPDKDILIRNALAIVAVPVYGGRVAETAMGRLQKIKAVQTAVIPVVVYGNRDYEDALRELTDYMVQAGFMPLVAGAFIGEHSYSRPGMPIAAGRPDDADRTFARELGRKAVQKLEDVGRLEDLRVLKVPGNFPYKVKGAKTLQVPLNKEELCIHCGRCVDLCPTQAIVMRDFPVSDAERCIKCCACVKCCPVGARLFETPYTAMLFEKFSTPRNPEMWCE